MAKRQIPNNVPTILDVTPMAAIAGGEFQISGTGLSGNKQAIVHIGDVLAPIVVGSNSFVIAKVPDEASVGELVVGEGDNATTSWFCEIGIQIASGVHPVSSPAVDEQGNVFCTFSGSRGQKAPVSIYKVDENQEQRPFLTDLLNPTGLAFDSEGLLYISSRHEGTVYRATPTGDLSVFVEGMGVATGIAFDNEQHLYVGDRSGTIFKISPQKQIYVFTTLEPSISAYHLAFGADGFLYVTGPTTSSYDAVQRVSPDGHVETFYRGLGRPQGLAFDLEGNLYVAASMSGRRGIVKIDRSGTADLFLSGPNIVGLAFAAPRSMVIATTDALYRADINVAGKPLP